MQKREYVEFSAACGWLKVLKKAYSRKELTVILKGGPIVKIDCQLFR